MIGKMAIVCNGDTPANIMPKVIFGSSGVAIDEEVHNKRLEPADICSGYLT